MKVKKYYKIKPYIHYSNCHEDANMIINNANEKVNKVLSICSGGDNSFACLLLNPSSVVCIDTNITQIYLAELKKIAIKYLSHTEYLEFIGIKDGDSLYYYNQIKKYLSSEVSLYFDKYIFLIEKVKIVNCGRFEYYFQIFSRKVLPLIHRKKNIDKFMSCDSLDEQIEFYRKKFNNFRFQLLFKIFFSKNVMKRIGRDKDYFKYNKGSLSKELKNRIELGIFNNLNKNNPYLQYVIYNKYIDYPLYLQKDNYEIIKTNIDKIVIKHCSLDEELGGKTKYDLMNLSDVFEYMNNDLMPLYEEKINDSLNDKGRVIFWNMQNVREFKNKLIKIDVSLKNDLAFYYKNILVYEKR